MNVLIVDDNAESLYMLQSLLAGNGYVVTAAKDGQEALDLLKQQPSDLIVSDILMPKLDGFQLCRAVKADHSLKHIPFVFYTATYTTEKDRDFALSLGASRFIVKPTDPYEFIGIIREVLAAGEKGRIPTERPSLEKETEYLKEHQARLFKKLEDKIAQLEESEERYRSLIACAGDAIVTSDMDGRITSWNEAAEKIFDYEPGEIIGQDVSVLAPEELRAEQRDLMARLKERKLIGCLETVRVAKDGTRIPVGIALSIIKNHQGRELGISAVIRDMTERKKTEQFIQDIFESMGEGLAVVGPDMRIRTANAAYAKMAGFNDVERVKGMTCYEATHQRRTPCDAAACECPVSVSFKTGKPFTSLHRHIGPANGPTDVEVRSYPMKDRVGNITSVLEIIRDISSEKKLETQLRQAQKMEAVGQLAGGIAHDFNNILTAIIGYANLLGMRLDQSDPLRVNVEQILAASERAARLTHSLLAFSRKQLLNPEPTDLNQVIHDVEKLLMRLIGEDIELKTALPDHPLTIMADPGQIGQVLMNLATNARDAMPDGGVLTIEASETILDEAYVRTHDVGKPGPYALLRISDSGMGMDEKTREKIFEPFFTTKEIGKGTGLGLAMAYGIVKQHNGHINVYSEQGKGSVFTIYLPLISAETRKTQAADETADLAGTETVLLAEDDDAVRGLTRLVLTEFGYTVIEAKDGEEALTRFMEHPGVVDLVVLDVIMPKKNGREVYEEMRRLRPGVKVLFMSGYTAEIMHRRGIMEQGLPFVSKPISPTLFLKKMRDILSSE